MGAGARVITKPDTVVLDTVWFPFKDLVDRDDLTGGALNLVETLQEIPVTALSYHFIGSKEAHAIQPWMWLRVGREMATHHLVFVQL